MHRFCYKTFTFGRWYEHTIAGYTIVGFRTDIKLLEIFVHKNNREKKEIVNEIRSYVNMDKIASHFSVTRILILDMLTHFCHFKYKKDVKIPQGGVNWRTKKGHITGHKTLYTS